MDSRVHELNVEARERGVPLADLLSDDLRLAA
jgi:hypothetical protein